MRRDGEMVWKGEREVETKHFRQICLEIGNCARTDSIHQLELVLCDLCCLNDTDTLNKPGFCSLKVPQKPISHVGLCFPWQSCDVMSFFSPCKYRVGYCLHWSHFIDCECRGGNLAGLNVALLDLPLLLDKDTSLVWVCLMLISEFVLSHTWRTTHPADYAPTHSDITRSNGFLPPAKFS